MKYCPAAPIPRRGTCADDGRRECIIYVLGAYPASTMPQNIQCVDVDKNNSKCTCDILC